MCILKKYTGYNSADHGDVTIRDQEDSAHVGLLEPDQFYLSPSASANNSPLMRNGKRNSSVADGDRSQHLGSSEETDLSDRPHSPFNQEVGSSSDQQDQQSFASSGRTAVAPPLPPLEHIGTGEHAFHGQGGHIATQRPAHTLVRISDDETLDGRQRGLAGGDRHSTYEIDQEDDHRPLGLSGQRFTVKRDGKMRYCQKCKFEKPDRTHHCSSCKRCVLKMDHHCPWLNNCVGHNNYKVFYLFVFWTAVYCVVLVACTIPVVAEVINAPYNENVFDPQWIFMIFVGSIFGLCLVPFAIHHTLLIKANKTTIESFEKHKYRVGSSGEVMQSRVLNVFDLGKKKNFIQVLGPVWYLWLIPVRNSVGNGWSFPANDYGKSMLQVDDDDSSTFLRRGVTSSASSFHHSTHNGNEEHHRLHTQHPYPQQQERYKHQRQFSRNQQQQQFHQQLSSAMDPFGLTTDSDTQLDQEQQLQQHQQHYHRDLSMDVDNHVRPDSDVDSDDNGHGAPAARSFGYPGTPRRFRQYRSGFAPAGQQQQHRTHVQDSDGEDDEDDDIEPEEYVYDSDEPVTIRFTDHGR
ncbi:hypothetical protein BGZ83_004934 [Gryganskiella cystojenkinii]|nr:hypothetical protein BGZ83_004934 [Gryganskiella cystojenkinii]